jgi:hypothetical protein
MKNLKPRTGSSVLSAQSGGTEPVRITKELMIAYSLHGAESFLSS